MLLAFRGFVGYVLSNSLIVAMLNSVWIIRFFGLFGVYYSLQYLSLSDATVLTFLAPMFTIATGAIFLGEKMNWKQAVAGCKHILITLSSVTIAKLLTPVCSLVGVILIARPRSLFGKALQDITLADGTGSMVEETSMEPLATPSQRLGAVG